MNDNYAILKKSDAFQIVTDRHTARQLKPECSLRTILHESQLPLFDTWLREDSGVPILAFGRIFRRKPSGEQVLAGLPMAFCRDARAFEEYLRGYHATACRDPLGRIAATAFLILVADKDKASELRAFVKNLQAGGEHAAS